MDKAQVLREEQYMLKNEQKQNYGQATLEPKRVSRSRLGASAWQKMLFLYKTLGWRLFLATILKNVYSTDDFYMLRMPMLKLELEPVKTPRGKFHFSKATDAVFDELFESISKVNHEMAKEIIVRIMFFEDGFKNCFVLRDEAGQIAAFEWLIYPEENELLIEQHPNRFPKLKKHEVMLENVFVFPKYRSQGLVAYLEYLLTEKAKNEGYRMATTVTRKDQLSVLNDYLAMGFKLVQLHKETRLFRRIKRKRLR